MEKRKGRGKHEKYLTILNSSFFQTKLQKDETYDNTKEKRLNKPCSSGLSGSQNHIEVSNHQDPKLTEEV